MDVILALDLMGGRVVHGRKGERESYRPLTWGIAPSAEPAPYVSFLKPRFLYIADLDRIRGGTPQDEAVLQCAVQVERCFLDRGCRSPGDCIEMEGVVNVIGTETGARTLADLHAYTGGYLSVDVRDGRVIPWGAKPGAVLKYVDGMAFEGCILLNIDAVGTEQGLVREDLLELRSAYSGRLLYGGGVAGMEDLHLLADAGMDGAIIATAVHRNAIPLEMVRRGCLC
ncbi:MAG: HisA/HisF-related TIM barrel protein [Methanomicrobiaceae archaeon]|nr:HisA/HisF-related TIM barrel protein [Methanomicrobiaceae archaeon]